MYEEKANNCVFANGTRYIVSYILIVQTDMQEMKAKNRFFATKFHLCT